VGVLDARPVHVRQRAAQHDAGAWVEGHQPVADEERVRRRPGAPAAAGRDLQPVQHGQLGQPQHAARQRGIWTHHVGGCDAAHGARREVPLLTVRQTHDGRRRSRRQFLKTAPALGLAASSVPAPADAAAARGATASFVQSSRAPDGRALYESLGVRPLINARGTLTIIGGSIERPEVREAKSLANQHYAHLDELMEAAGRRFAELTGAEWGMVSSGCAAAMTHATAACVAGGNPDLHVRIPDLAGFAKDEVIIPTHSRNVYDAAIRAVGVRIVE